MNNWYINKKKFNKIPQWCPLEDAPKKLTKMQEEELENILNFVRS